MNKGNVKGTMEEKSSSHVIWGCVERSDSSPSSSVRSWNRQKNRVGAKEAVVSTQSVVQRYDHITFCSSNTSSADTVSDEPTAGIRPKVAASLQRSKDPKGEADIEAEDADEGQEEQEGQWSIGSEHHEDGQCKPCAWVWKPNGCVNGRNCKYCHTCAPGELKARKKERIAKLKATKHAESTMIISL